MKVVPRILFFAINTVDRQALKSLVAAQYNNQGTDWHAQRGSGHELLEKPAIYKLLPNVSGKRVLCLGCGFGEECAKISSLGATTVVGIDLSEQSVRQAKTRYPHLDFQVMDLEELLFPPSSFDVVFSSLVIHYLDDWQRALEQMSKVLTADGVGVLSTHHPATWSTLRDETDVSKRNLLGYSLDKQTSSLSLFGDYLSERQITAKFSGTFEATFFHKTFSGMLREFRRAGFRVTECVEPAPIEEAREADPTFWEIRSRFPLFILFRLEKQIAS